MRFNLKVPFAEKEAAKKLGARWDAARKVWYVVNQDDMQPFTKWSPTAHDDSEVAPSPPKKAAVMRSESTGKVYVGSQYVELPVVCECPPWEVCEKCKPHSFSG